MELVYDKDDYKFVSKPMPIFIHEETDDTKNYSSTTSDINVTKLYQYELFSNLNEKISSNMKRYMILFIIILLLLILFIILIN